MDEVVDFLTDEKPDILALQEVYVSKDKTLEKQFHTIEQLRRRIHLSSFLFVPAFLQFLQNGKQTEQGCAIFSRYPITPVDNIFYDEKYKTVHEGLREEWPHYPRLLQEVKVDLQGRVINVFNTHGIWGENGEDNERRLHMSEVIINSIKNKDHIILSGDFNVNQGTKTIKNISDQLVDIFDDELKSSFNMRHKPKESGYGTAVVDHIFVSRDMRVTNHYMPDVNVSDHMPLVAILEV